MSEGSSKGNKSPTCGICEELISKYCCPRCDVFYCSLNCYKSEKHLQCSENFYRDCINEQLASHNVDDESKHKMIGILKRINDDEIEQLKEDEGVPEEKSDSDDEEAIDLEERMKDLNLDDVDAVWNALTDDERNDFQALLDDCNDESIVPQWEPWWMYSRKDKLVEEVTEKNYEEEALKKCPPLKTVTAFNSLTKTQPSSAIKFNIANVLASYVFIMRHFNGEVEPLEGVVYLLEVCANLKSNVNFEDAAAAVKSVAQQCRQSTVIDTDEPSLDVMKYDTYQLLWGPSEKNKPYYCKAALSHLIDLLRAAKSSCKNTKVNSKRKSKGAFSKRFPDYTATDKSKLEGSQIKKMIKKVEYYLSFVQSYGMDIVRYAGWEW